MYNENVGTDIMGRKDKRAKEHNNIAVTSIFFPCQQKLHFFIWYLAGYTILLSGIQSYIC